MTQHRPNDTRPDPRSHCCALFVGIAISLVGAACSNPEKGEACDLDSTCADLATCNDCSIIGQPNDGVCVDDIGETEITCFAV
jgi:hypothetical protein